MTSEKEMPRLSKDEALDLSNKLQGLDGSLSPTQRNFLHFAVNRVSVKNQPDVAGYDYESVYDTGYYDMNTGLEIYAVDWYSNYGGYEGTTYYE